MVYRIPTMIRITPKIQTISPCTISGFLLIFHQNLFITFVKSYPQTNTSKIIIFLAEVTVINILGIICLDSDAISALATDAISLR